MQKAEDLGCLTIEVTENTVVCSRDSEKDARVVPTRKAFRIGCLQVPAPRCGWPAGGQEPINTSGCRERPQTRGAAARAAAWSRVGPSAAGPSPVHRPMHLCLSHSPSPQQLLRAGGAQLRPLRSLSSCLARPPKPQGPKKQVVFADTKGLSLTSVHLFEDAVGGDSEEGSCHLSSFPRPAPPQPSAPRASWPLGRTRGFRRRQQSRSVCPEQSAGRGRCLRGPVPARTLAFQKAVQTRTTFDASDSFQEAPQRWWYSGERSCIPEAPCVHTAGPCRSETDSFGFQVARSLESPGPEDAIRFCISLGCAQQLSGNNNQGQNCCVVPSSQSCSSD
ncbi:protein phosphatase 1 regulatory subunit 3C-like [Zalophus californianus]|uniref:Protein phosphatase 1 regulatory subunit 3C-like n=1 Tax=Zalophus californianus TaxID=9704 RepID=A0A6J2DI29_ZALCA|nr:protein phosphatase 1 regulatory subunit 3C-like [Zalophus californianus]